MGSPLSQRAWVSSLFLKKLFSALSFLLLRLSPPGAQKVGGCCRRALCLLVTGRPALAPRSHRVENSSDCSPGLPCQRSREGQWLPRPPGRLSPENPVSLLSVTRWTGSSVMAAAVGGSIRSVLVSLPRRPRRRTTCVRAVRRRTRRAGDKTRRAPSVRTWLGDSQFLSKAAGLAFKPACKRCYFYSLWDHFSRTL